MPARERAMRWCFTKRIGTGVISTALKQGIAKESDVEAAVAIDVDAQSRSLRSDAAPSMCMAARM